MRFKVVSVGWQCAQWLEATLQSIEDQSLDNWDVWIAYDPSQDDGAQKIQDWCDSRDDRWSYTINDVRKFAVRNQYESIRNLNPSDEDVVVFLDLDGDRFANVGVLERLAKEYSDGTLLTYGSYEPVPYVATCSPAVPFPEEVVADNGYRKYIRSGNCCFNHLRTMSGKVFNAIPESHFKWARGPSKGEWYVGGTDYIFMIAGLELAGGRYKCIDATLCLYNNSNPNADYLYHPEQASACTQDYLRRTPLEPLGES